MRYWWVNQNQTFRQEIGGGYLWSPKRNANGARNPFYESMREVSPGDLIFSFVDTRIVALGIAQSYCYESPKPAEFGEAGLNWEAIGWRIRVHFTRLLHQVRPKDHMQVLGKPAPYRMPSTSGLPRFSKKHLRHYRQRKVLKNLSFTSNQNEKSSFLHTQDRREAYIKYSCTI